MAMNWNDRDVAQGFMGTNNRRTPNPVQAPAGDRNQNGVPDREELSIKVSRPFMPPNGVARGRNPTPGVPRGPVTPPVTTPVEPNNPAAYFPQGLDLNNFRQFMQTPAGAEHMRSIIERVRKSMTPQGQRPRGIFDRLLRNIGG